MRRRDFIAGIAGSAAAWPMAARAQQGGDRVRRIGWLTASFGEVDLEIKARRETFVQALRQLGWMEAENIHIDFRSGGGSVSSIQKYAAELVALADVVLANGGQAVRALQQASRSVPIVFVQVPDPVGAGFVDSLARPANNTTGFTSFEYGISTKWLELLKEIAPAVKRVGVLRDPGDPAGSGQWGAIQSAAPSFRVELRPINSRAELTEIERAITTFASQPDGGLIFTANTGAAGRRDPLIALTSRYKLPATFPNSYYVAGGGLMSYGADIRDQYRRAAGYVDRIIRGEKPADLPVQAPTKYELSINLKTAKALGLDVPATVLARADEVIE